jgi:hypothetical protein
LRPKYQDYSLQEQQKAIPEAAKSNFLEPSIPNLAMPSKK